MLQKLFLKIEKINHWKKVTFHAYFVLNYV